MEQIRMLLAKQKEQNSQMQEQYEREIAELPKGNIVTKQRNTCEYYYLHYYCKMNKKATSEYIGTDKSIIPIIEEQIEKRKQLELKVKDLEEDLETIEKMLKLSHKRTDKQIKQNNLRAQVKEVRAQKNTSPKNMPKSNPVIE